MLENKSWASLVGSVEKSPALAVVNFLVSPPRKRCCALNLLLSRQLILKEHRLILQAHMFAFEIKLLMAKCIHCPWFHKLGMAGTIMFSKYWWLFLFARGTGLSLTFTAVVHALHLEKEKGVEREKKSFVIGVWTGAGLESPLCLWNENDPWLILRHFTKTMEAMQVQVSWANQDKVSVTLNYKKSILHSGEKTKTLLLSVVRRDWKSQPRNIEPRAQGCPRPGGQGPHGVQRKTNSSLVLPSSWKHFINLALKKVLYSQH